MIYNLDFQQFHQHLVQVSCHFTATTANPRLWMPAWIPGSYLIREFSRHIDKVSAKCQSDEIVCYKISKNEWQLEGVTVGDKIELTYQVYAYDLSVRGAYVDQTRIYLNFSSVLLTVETETTPEEIKIERIQQHKDMPVPQEDDDSSIVVNIGIPDHFLQQNATLATTLPLRYIAATATTPACYQLTANHYWHLIDHPVELAVQDSFEFAVADIPHRFVLSGRHHANLPRLQQDLSKICQAYIDWLGEAPFNQYLFMTITTGSDYGGLEHKNCTSLITPRSDLPLSDESDEPSKSYQRFLGLCSHEYFHAWLVKTIMPDVMTTTDLKSEAYTPLLWVFEGFTSYIDDLMLYRSGVINQKSYLTLLADQINRYNATPGRQYQSVADASFDAWIKLYRSDENTANAGVSYYNKGALIGLCLDLQLRAHRTSLADIIVSLYHAAKQQQPVSISSMNRLLGEVMGEQAWQQFYTDYIVGTKDLPIDNLLGEHGITSVPQEHYWEWGMQTKVVPQGLEVTRVQRDSSAAKAGISAKDTIVAIDNIQATSALLTRYRQYPKPLACHVFRRDELLTLQVTPDLHPIEKIVLKTQDMVKVTSWLS